jgi:predicted kinase|tara:strand:- start:329 stop:1078 length:750 start_codon:yes stop_codon:yes gene_type:complete
MDLLNEGVYDKGILKAVFMAGGPGSGKSYVASQLFGIPKKVNISVAGLKSVNSDTEFEHLLKKYGFETVGGGLDIDLWPDDVFHMVAVGDEDSENPSLRKYAKLLTKARREQYMSGRLGMIIDGTGHDYAKLSKEKKQLEQLGYDTYMVFVNTSLEVALKRNSERNRKLPEKLLTKSWQDVQHNLGKFQGLFSRNFAVVDNSKFLSEKDAIKKFGMITKKYINNFIKQPVKNPKGKKWVKKQLILKGKK